MVQGEGRTTVRFIILKKCMLLNENEDKILTSNIIACIIVIKAAATASKRFSTRGKKTANEKKRKLWERYYNFTVGPQTQVHI